MVDQELTGQAGGVGETPPAAADATPGQEPGVAGQPTAAGTPAIAEEKKVDLTQLPEFRSWQAARDRREAQLQRQLDDGQRQAGEMQRQLAELQLANADPEEVAVYYQEQAAQLQADQERQAAVAAEQREILTQAEELLKDLGLAADTPGLEWSDKPTWDGLATLAKSAARVVALQNKVLVSEQGAVTAEAAQAAKTQALRQAGVTKVSTATGAAPAGDNPIANIDDPNELLKMAMGKGRR